ncbi:sulfatase [Flammeovirgaceae bacterium 311]|nr:sulfatase [Flammeovirgaceae bacterium 311]
MKKPQVQFLICLLSICSLLGCSTANESKKEAALVTEKPNVIIVVADQWRAEAFGYAGNPDVITPNFDRLASESINFDHAVAVMPVCSPWRASLMTGQYPLTHGLFYNDKPLPTEAVTMGKLFKGEGYQTAFIGKWHMNGHERHEHPFAARSKPIPAERRQGFDYWKACEVTHDYNNSLYFDEQNQKHIWPGYDAFPQTDSAISYIRKHKEKPFLMVLSWGPPHDPYNTAPEEYRKLYDPAKLTLRPNVAESDQDSARWVLANYYAHCTALDKAMGDLMKALDDEGVADNTILIFTSDHGDMLMSKGVLKKQRPWDESARIPMLLRYPQKLGKEAVTIKAPINTPDILPSLLGLCNMSVPASVEGKNFSASILKKEELDNDAVLVMLPVPFHEWAFKSGGREYRAVRTSRYTYARDLFGPWLLYDNENDPYQLNNLVGNAEFAGIQKELEETLQQKLEETGDRFLPADAYMAKWNYLYDFDDSLRPDAYYQNLKKLNIKSL